MIELNSLMEILRFLLVFGLIDVIFVNSQTPVKFEINPGCDVLECKNIKFQIVYGRCIGYKESLHYVWYIQEFEYPTLLLARTSDPRSQLSISWKRMINQSFPFDDNFFGSVSFTGNYQHITSSVTILKSLYGYNDTNDSVDILDPSNTILKTFSLNSFSWNVVLQKNRSALLISCNATHESYDQGKIKVVFQPHVKMERNENLPKLLFNNKSSELSFVFNNIEFEEKAYNGVRLALHLNLLGPSQFNTTSSADNNRTIDFVSYQSVNDIFSPKTFIVNHIRWNWEKFDSEIKKLGLVETNYLKWRTIGYTSKSEQSTTFAKVFSLSNATFASLSNNRLLAAFYNSSVIKKSLLIAFGKKGDGFYSSTKHLKLTTIIGFGLAPSDGFSIAAVCVFTLLMGTPMLVLIGCCLTPGLLKYRKMSRRLTINDVKDNEPLIKD